MCRASRSLSMPWQSKLSEDVPCKLQILPDVDVRPPAAARWLIIIIVGLERVPFICLVKQKQRPAPVGGSPVCVGKVFSSPSTRAAFRRPGQAFVTDNTWCMYPSLYPCGFRHADLTGLLDPSLMHCRSGAVGSKYRHACY